MDRDFLIFLDAVKNLTTAVRDFLHADDGCDDQRIVDMDLNVRSVLNEARDIPALKTWAEQSLAEDEL